MPIDIFIARTLSGRWSASNLLLGLCFLLFFPITSWAAEGGKRVLIVHSFGSGTPPFTTHSIAFETKLAELLGNQVDLDEVSLDHARYADPNMEEALLEYLQKRQAKWQPALVVPVGSPAGIFIEKYRERLFPETPILYTGMDRRRLGSDALRNNAAFVGESFNGPGFVEDMLQIAPQTTNIVCIIGASQLERYWTAAFQSEFAPFTNRVSFTWLNDLPFDQMLERVQNLPPRSFIFLILLVRDAAGVTHNADEALSKISKVANAPVHGIFEHQLGRGIVGGRLYRAELEGIESAQLAVRILQGEPASNFPAVIVEPTGPQYDSRELRKWNIGKDRLPPGSIVKFRQATAWEQYRVLIVIGLSLLALQSALIAGLVVNLRKRRKAERALRESDERMNLAAGAGLIGMWEWDFESDKVWVNDRARQKIDPDQIQGSSYSQFIRMVHPDDRDALVQAVSKAIRGEGEFQSIHRQFESNGKIKWIEASGRVEFDAKHKPLKMRGVAQDVTARKLAEEQVRESERQFLSLANSAPLFIWTAGPDMRCTFVNQSWLDFRGRTLEEELAYGWSEGVHPDDLANCLKVLDESVQTQKPFTMEYRLRRHDGQFRWILDHGTPRFDPNGQLLGFIGSCIDLTERKAAEAEARRSQEELAHVNRVSTLGALTGSLAHELRQPLAVILSSAEAGRQFMQGGQRNDEEVRDALKDIEENGRRAAEIIKEMRTMLKKDSEQMTVQDMNHAVRVVLEMVRSDLLTRGATVTLQLDPLLPPVKGNGVQLRQVVLNLVMNACDAMSEEPLDQREVTIETRRLTADEVAISVSDKGPGFSQEMLGNTFEPFRTTKAQGLGLGLAICRSIIAAHGGSLEATNNQEKGATVTFTLLAQKEVEI